MTIPELIEEILNEWAYRLEDGTPNVKNPKHIKVLDSVLSELCLNEVKDLIIESLEEADKSFSNPILNKKVKYKNAKGEDTEGIVGNLLRQPEGSPGRDAAEKLLPPEGSPERDALNKDLGGEGQPTKPEDEKGKEGGGEAGGGEEEKAKAAAAMFDPKADPAMAARMDTEKDTLAKIAGEKETEKAKEKDSVEKQDSKLTQYINKDFDETPDKDFEGLGDDEVEKKEIEARSKFTDIQKEKGEDSPEAKAAKADWAKHMTEKNKRKGDMENAAMWDSIRQDNDPSYDPKKKDGPAGGPGAETPKQEPGRPDTTPPEEAPSEPAKREPANDDPESKAQKFKGKKSGEEIQTMEIEGGGFVYGTKHGNTAMVDDILDDVKSKIPKERWGDIVFVGEGGATNDETGEIDFNDEMDYAVPKFKELGAGVDTWDGDDMDVHKSDSKLYQKQKEKTGLKDNQILAGNWASMVGQGEGEGLDPNDPEHSMKAKDYLDDEGKQFLQDAAKEAGLPPIEDFDNPTGEKPSEENGWKGTGDRGTLYRLAFPDDNGDKPTKINDVQVAFNEARDEHLIEKNKELTAQGKIPITIAGESHVDLVDKMTRKSSETKPEQPSGEKPEEKPTEKPAKKDFSKEEPGQEATASGGKRIYSIGGGYYSDKKGGPAKYVRTESIVDMAFEDVITEDVFALFEKTISATLANGETIKVSELPPRAQKKATDKAKAAAKSSAEQPAAKKTDGTDVPGKFTPIKTPPPANEKGVEKDGKIAGTTIETEPSLKDADPEFLKQKSTEMNKYYENFKEDKKKAEGIAREKLGYSEEQVKGLKGDEKKAYDDEVKKNQAPTYNLCKVSVPGTNLFCAGNKGIPRAKMPQFKGEPREGTQAWDVLQKAKESDPTATEADGEPYFRQMLADKGVKVTDAEVPSESLKATQSELVGDKVLGMKSVLDAGPSHPAYKKMTAPLYVSKDGYVVDGHHRWAAITAYNMEHPDNPLPLKAMIIDQDIDQAIETSNDFADEFGVAAKSGKQTGADANKEQPAQQKPAQQKPAQQKPAKPTKNKKATLSPKEKYKQQARDNRIQAKKDQAADRAADGDTAPKGPSAFGQVPDNLPKKDVKTAIKDGVKNWSEKEKSFFKEKVHKGNSPERRSWGQAIRDKAKGAIAAIKKGVKHEIEEFKAAGVGLKNFFSGKPVSEHEQKALKAVGIKIITTALFGAAFGGLAHGAVAFAQHVAIEFIPHVIGETILKGVGTAAIFAGPEEENEDILMEKFMGMIAEKMASEKIPAELMLEMIESYNAKKETKKEMKIESLIKEIISEITIEASNTQGGDWKLAARKGGPEGKIVYFGSKEKKQTALDNGTHVDVDKNLKAKDSTSTTKQPVKTVATDKDLQARVSREKAALDKEKKKTSKPSGNLSNKMEDDDLYFPKKKIADKTKEAANIISKLPMSKDEKKILIGIVGKALNGEQLTKAERKFANDWITFPATSKPKIYFAPSKGDFKTHISLEMGEMADRESFNEYLEQNEIFDAGHAVKKKSMVASKLTENRKQVKVEGVVKDKNGKTQSCKIGNTTFTRYPEPSKSELLKEFKAKGIANPEEEVNNTLIAIRRHNDYVEFIAAQKDIETIDFGHDTDTPDGRKNTIESIKTMMYDKLYADFKKFFKGKVPDDAQNILNLIKSLSNPYNGNSPERMQEEIDAIARLMNANPEFRAGVPDMQEIFDFMVKLGQGYAGFMPSASNWKVTDIVTFKPSQDLKVKKGESPAQSIANNFQAIISTALIEGGLSVKYEKGGASAGYDKVMMTVYKKHNGFDTQKEIIGLFDTYKWSFTPGEENRVKSVKEIDAKEKELNSVLERAKKAGILTDEEITEIQMEGEDQAARMAAKIDKKVPFKKYKQCFGKTDKEQKENYENYKKQCGMWCKMGAIAEKINNNDMEYQMFGNLRTVYPKKGEPRHETIDGVTTLSGMGWSFDPGIAAVGKECKFLSLNNANSSHIEPVKRKG